MTNNITLIQIKELLIVTLMCTKQS